MQLDLRNAPDLVRASYSQSSAEAGEVLDIEVAYEQAGRQLVIVGSPGSGKTTEALKLMRHLLEVARSDPTAPVPEMFPLASWAKERKPIMDWLADQLQLRHGWPPREGRALIWNHHVMPVLDGLDEVAPEQRAECVREVNRFWENYRNGPLVLCSRQAEYEELEERVKFGGAFVVCPPDASGIDEYLAAAGLAWDPLRTQLRTGSNPFLLELFTTPLMLSTAVLAYENQDPSELGETQDVEGQRDRLWSRYVSTMRIRGYGPDTSQPPDSPSYTEEQVTRWLGWVAREMRSRNETELWLHEWSGPPGFRTKVSVGAATILGLALGLVVALDQTLSEALTFGLVLALLSALAVGLSGGRVFKPAPAYHVPFDRRRLAVSILRGTFAGVGGGLALGGFGVPARPQQTPLLVFALAVGVVFMLFSAAALPLGLGQSLNREKAHRRTSTPALPLVDWLFAGLLTGLFVWLVGRQSGPLIHALGGGLIFGVFFGRPLKPETDRGRFGLARSLVGRLFVGLFGALAFVLAAEMFRSVDSSESGPIIGLIIGLVGAILFGLAFALTSFDPDRERFAPGSPSQLIVDSTRIGVLFGLVFGTPAGLAAWKAASTFSSKPGLASILGVSFGLVIGLILGLAFGLDCVLFHLAFLVWLRAHDRGPVRWVRFLEWACDHLLLRSTGASYEWAHLELRDYMERRCALRARPDAALE
jgi:hypothetical protein